MSDRDFLDEVIEERSSENPDFPLLVEAAGRRRALLQQLGQVRESKKLSQTVVAAAMKTSQSSVARLEGTADDARLSTIDRISQVLGYRVQWHLIPVQDAAQEPAVIVHRPR